MSKKKPKPNPAPLSKNAIAIALHKEFGKSIRTTWGWFDRGCPSSSLEEAREWAKSQPLRDAKQPKPDPEQFVDEGVDSNDCLDDLAAAHPEKIETILTMREHGAPQNRIAACTGFSQSLVSRIIRTHPRTKELERPNSLADWRDVRRLAVGRLKLLLEDPNSKLRPSELGMIAGIAHDKLENADSPPPVNLSIRAKIEAMTYQDLINSIKKAQAAKAEIIDGEIQSVPYLLPGPVPPDGGRRENETELQQGEPSAMSGQ